MIGIRILFVGKVKLIAIERVGEVVLRQHVDGNSQTLFDGVTVACKKNVVMNRIIVNIIDVIVAHFGLLISQNRRLVLVERTVDIDHECLLFLILIWRILFFHRTRLILSLMLILI
jgi:hypothetical protein